MKKSSQYWIVGCASGCGLVVLAVAALFAGGALFVKKSMKGFNEAIETRKTLDEKYGATAEFTPWPDGAVPPERMEAFLAVRDATAPARQKVVETFAALPASAEAAEELDSKPFFEKMRAVLDIAGSSMGLGVEMGELFEARNRALLAHDMGLGEYTYIYVTAYYLFLGHPMNDRGKGLPMPNTAAKRLPRELLAMLKSQLAALPDTAGAPWRSRLADEVAALERDGGRLPWQDGLPAAISASMEPYRERLEATYVPEANPLELARNRRRGMGSIEAE